MAFVSRLATISMVCWLLVACGPSVSVPFAPPAGMTSMEGIGPSELYLKTELRNARVWKASVQDGKGLMDFGLMLGLQPDTGRMGVQLFGAKYGQGWVEDITLESDDWQVDEIEIEQAYMGDPQGNGTPDLIFLVRVESTQISTGMSQTRRAILDYGLVSEKLKLVLFATIQLKGECRYGNRQVRYDLTARPEWVENQMGHFWGLKLDSNVFQEVCIRGKDGRVVCGKERTDEVVVYGWEPMNGIYTRDDKSGVQLIPDINIR